MQIIELDLLKRNSCVEKLLVMLQSFKKPTSKLGT
jgi:hypothetical protein